MKEKTPVQLCILKTNEIMREVTQDRQFSKEQRIEILVYLNDLLEHQKAIRDNQEKGAFVEAHKAGECSMAGHSRIGIAQDWYNEKYGR